MFDAYFKIVVCYDEIGTVICTVENGWLRTRVCVAKFLTQRTRVDTHLRTIVTAAVAYSQQHD